MAAAWVLLVGAILALVLAPQTAHSQCSLPCLPLVAGGVFDVDTKSSNSWSSSEVTQLAAAKLVRGGRRRCHGYPTGHVTCARVYTDVACADMACTDFVCPVHENKPSGVRMPELSMLITTRHCSGATSVPPIDSCRTCRPALWLLLACSAPPPATRCRPASSRRTAGT